VISTLLVEHPWLTPAALAVLVVLGPLVGRWLAPRPRAAWVCTALALLPVAALTLVPVDRELFGRCEVAWVVPTFSRVELFANVVLLVPAALAAAVALRRPLLALLAGSALSAAIELFQALVPSLGRSCSTNDWLANTVGAALGAALGWVALRWAAPPRSTLPG
jgi:hypothetical protein